MSTERGSRVATSDPHGMRRSGGAAAVALYSIAAIFLVASLALMTQWLLGDPIGGAWLLAGLLSVCGVTSLIASVRGARGDDDAGGGADF